MAIYADLNRFTDAQANAYHKALAEIKSGRKGSHWMWYIFPQLKGLGLSSISQHYGIIDIGEAQAYKRHPALGHRLREITGALLNLDTNDANEVFGSPDDLKLRSSMTLFNALEDTDPVFNQVLTKFFQGKPDPLTLALLNRK